MASRPIRSDRALELRLRAALAIDGVDVRAVAGDVVLVGTVEDEATAARLPVEAKDFPGVVSVRAKLSWPR
jgi:osmotically-inducible protein OsmY